MSSENDQDEFVEWGVESPDGRIWTYRDPVIARIVSREQGKPILERVVTRTPWSIVGPLDQDVRP